MHVLRLENLRNFLPSKDSIVVLTLIAWAAIVTSAHRLSQGAFKLGRGIVGSRFLYEPMPRATVRLFMTNNFNTYIESPAVDYLRELCLREG